MPIAPGLGQIVAVQRRADASIRCHIVRPDKATELVAAAEARPDLYARVYVATVFRVTEMPEPDA